MINIITWNCQGAASKAFLRAAKWLISSEKPSIFDHWARVEALGFSGGIWVMWNNNVTMDIIASNPQFILANVEDDMENKWSIAFVYASPTPHLRRKIWSTLKPERFGGRKPWIAVGDFNSVSSAEEVSNRDTFALHRNANFNHWIFQEGLIDMGYSGARFTWMRGKSSESFKGARLDRALGSTKWMDTFPDTSIIHLPMFSSDHSPIKVVIGKGTEGPRNRFFFQATWPAHEDIDRVVSETWTNTTQITINTNHIAEALSKWNRDTFGNIHAKKRKLMARLGGIQKTMVNNWHNGIVRLNKKLSLELEEVLNQEELLWYQQSRENWIRSGDKHKVLSPFHEGEEKTKQMVRIDRYIK